MSGLFGAPPSIPPLPAPPPAPAMNDETVLKAAADEQTMRQRASGRASTFLTNAQTQRTAQPNEQNYLGSL